MTLSRRSATDTCNAIRRGHEGGYCSQPAGWGTDHVGHGRCKLHAGASLRGPAHPNFKNGEHSSAALYKLRNRYKDVFPDRNAADFDLALDDPDWLAVNTEMALLRTRLMETLRRVESGEAARQWAQARAALARLEAARPGNLHEEGAALLELRAALHGGGDYGAWQEARELIAHIDKLANTERKRIEAGHRAITAQQLEFIMATFSRVILDNVTDRDVLARVSAALEVEYRRAAMLAELPPE